MIAGLEFDFPNGIRLALWPQQDGINLEFHLGFRTVAYRFEV